LAKKEQGMTLNTLKIVTGDLEENCFVVWSEGLAEAVVFDPGSDAETILDALRERNLTVTALILTHCHGDHIGALGALKSSFPAAPIYVPDAEKDWLTRPTLNLSYFYGYSIVAPPGDVFVNDGDAVSSAGLNFKAIHVPGHSPGGTAYFIAPENAHPHLYCGDILFQRGIGRTDLPGGAGEEVLVEGIRENLFALPDDTIVFPGHGDETTIGDEKENNPYCGMG
jgi:hydroxyacylglutathione hydrolase